MAMYTHRLAQWRTRGITLLETLLALAVGAIVITASVSGINRYTEGVQTQAAGGQLQRIIEATDTWADDNYETLLAQAPQVYSVADTQTRLTPYLGGSFPQDAYRNSYRLATRAYNYTVPDPAGGTVTRQALQVLIVGFNNGQTPLKTEDDLRINIANTAGRGAGFIATPIASCNNGSGGRLAAGNICGAYGSYALPASRFPSAALTNALITGLVTKGDSSFYGDQLYRYDYGDPDLNTMRTTLYMDSAGSGNPNEIQSPRRGLTLRSETTAGGEASITVGQDTGAAADQGNIVLQPGNTRRVVVSAQGGNPELVSNTGVLLMGRQQNQSLTHSGGGTITTALANGQVRSNQMFASLVGTNEVSSLWRRGDSPLRLQNFTRGEVIIGQRGRYSPRNAGAAVSGLNYELSDGRLIAGHVVSQDITCADCGGSLSEILPRWRHMGSYFIGYTRAAGTRVNHPSCGSSFRGRQNRNATSETQAFRETAQDTRYRPAILLIPRQIRSKDVDDSTFDNEGGDWADVPMDSHLRATQPVDGSGNPLPFWNVLLHKETDNVYTTAFALTYCVFTGGNASMTDPTYTTVPGLFANTPSSIGTWTALP